MKKLYYSNVRFAVIPLLTILILAFISAVSGSAFLSPAFEPFTLILLGFGLLGLARFGRKAKQ